MEKYLRDEIMMNIHQRLSTSFCTVSQDLDMNRINSKVFKYPFTLAKVLFCGPCKTFKTVIHLAHIKKYLFYLHTKAFLMFSSDQKRTVLSRPWSPCTRLSGTTL